MAKNAARVFLGLAYCLLVSLSSASAEVKAVVITSRLPWLDGKPVGSVGAYEKLQGHITYTIDPKAKGNERIADITLAPRDAHGMVEFTADFVVVRPVDPAKARSTVFLEILNRGKSNVSRYLFQSDRKTPFRVETLDGVKLRDAFLFERGFTVAWVGWQFDLPKGTIRVDVPAVPAPGLVREAIAPDAKELASGIHSLKESYCAADAEQAAATLSVKASFAGPAQLLLRSSWSFAHRDDGKAVPDACSILLPGGIKPGKEYEAVYQGAPSPVAGLGLAAVRDFVSYLKFGGVPSALRESPQTEQHVLGYGYSQSARFLRQYLYQGFNADEHGRQAFDAMFIASAGGGRGSFNQRYAMPGEAGNSVMSDLRPVDLFPFTDGDDTDPFTGKRDGLLDEAKKSKTVPKIFYTYSSSEYWARVGSLAYTTVDGKRELPIDGHARLYFFAGVPHAHGIFPVDKIGLTPGQTYENYGNFASSWWAFRALVLDLDAWMVSGEEPPPSVYPRPGHDLVAREQVRFPKIPGLEFPSYTPQNWRMDFGKEFAVSGVPTIEPPKLGPEYPVLVPQVDEDGNDRGGIALPFVAVPLGTFTGWNYELPKLESFHYLAGLIGSFQQFACTKADRDRSGDPRLSIAERYADRADYLAKVHAASLALVGRKLLLAEDLGAIEKESEGFWDGLTVDDQPHNRNKKLQ
ncbi:MULTISPECIES: alpha/beta hydrolase domain-containing protein [Acidobacteriaceae]|uniref:Alpha/beta hydrolase domain-containing protein n=1 Tax=Granulicella sibirica TaxID=2479048 RepID=A0A4Q0SWX0_9BACT|nr:MULTISPECIES: alpha/beta hydrolase domain-containing protein [Acidobacteriaceae]RXH54450.1 hypothetical protein GRAN_4746 [Granulicella sibirica]